MPIGLGTALWAYVAPLDAVNIDTNPSFEFGTQGVVAIQSATLGTTSQFQRYGAWSLKVTPNSNGTSGAILGTWSSGIGTTYSVSAWAFVEAGVPMRIAIGDGNGLNLTSGSVTFTGGGTWQWYNTGIIEVSNTNRSLVIQKTSGNSQLPFYVDGVMINPWTDSVDRVLTYFDGDTGGGTWQGAQQNSISTRSGQYRGGGSIIALSDLGLQVDQMPGAGVMPIENSAQSYAVTDGAQFQRQRAAQRTFTLTAKPIIGTSLADFHATRRTLFDAFKPDLVTPQQPIHFLYYGGQGTIGIDAYYAKGLELGNMDGPIAENAAISFVAYDPYWYAPTQQGTTLAPRSAIGSANYMVQRSPLGKWGSVGQGAGPNSYVYDLLSNGNGTIFAAGNFTTLDGTVGARFLGQYIPQTNTWGTLIGGTAGAETYSLAYSPAGTLFFSGSFTTVAGTAGARYIARWANNLFGTLQGGTVATQTVVYPTLMYSPTGTLFAGGDFTTAAGTASGPTAFWTGANWGTLAGGSLSQTTYVLVYDLLYAKDNSIYAAGSFTRAGGTLANNIARYANGGWGTMGGGFVWPGNTSVGTGLGATLTQAPNGVLFAGGLVGTLGNSIVTSSIFQWNGIAESAVSPGGIGNGTVIGATASIVFKAVANPSTGQVFAAGGGWNGVVGSVLVPDNMAIWSGASWLPLDLDLDDANAQIRTVAFTPTGGMLLGGSFAGTAHAASVGTIVNTGRAIVYPNLRIRNLATGTARIYQMLNTTTGDGIYFNYSMLPSEQLTLTLQPGQRAFQSTSFGNVFNTILPGSNLATFNLLPGQNYISFFSDNDSVEASFFWQSRGWSIDSGTTT